MCESFLLFPVFKITSWFPSILLRQQWHFFIFLLVSVCLLSIIMDHTYICCALTPCSYYTFGAQTAHVWLDGAYLSWWGTFLEEIVPANLLKLGLYSKNIFLFFGRQGLADHVEVEAPTWCLPHHSAIVSVIIIWHAIASAPTPGDTMCEWGPRCPVPVSSHTKLRCSSFPVVFVAMRR